MTRSLTLLSLTALTLMTTPAWADGMLLPQPHKHPIAPIQEIPNFSIKHHRVQVNIKDQIAKTTVDQVFHNNYHQDLEGTYLFPIPEGANISKFQMDVNGKMQGAELLTAQNARQIYQEIVRRRIDPGLLEYAGQNLYRASVFPIPAKGDKQIDLAYEQVLERKEQQHHYRYGLSTEKLSAQPLQNASVSIDLQSKEAIKNVYSPSHDISVQKIDDHHVKVSWEASNIKPDQDFDLYWTTSEDAIGANLFTYQEPGEDGYFMFLASPKVKWDQNSTQARRMTFVVDTSGSMAGEKIQQAREALVFNLNQLEGRDSFHLMSFSDTINPFTPKPVKATAQELKPAIAHAKQLEATGGTNINDALLEAMKVKGDGVPMILFLTDGDPTVGVTDFNEILKNVKQANQQDVRLFVFGVGYDVNIPFLDKLAKENHGSTEFVRPDESIESKVSRLFSQISNPILTSPSVSWGSAGVHDVLPTQMPDIFKGSQMLVVGRYRQSGNQDLVISGQVNGQNKSFSFPKQSFAKGKTEHSYLPRLWASRRIGQLLDQIRLSGQNKELIEEIIRLSKQYGIITEYTSFLVREEVDVRARADAAPMMMEAEDNLNRSLSADKGAWAVSQSQNASNMQKSSAAPAAGGSYLNQEGKVEQITQVKYVAQRAFYLKQGTWQDSLPAEKLPIVSIQRFSPLYFELAQQGEIKDILALGDKVEFVLNQNLVKIADQGEKDLTETLKKKLGL